MKCQECSAPIDYGFTTNCEQCGSKVEPTGLSQHDSSTDLEDRPNRLQSGLRRVANFVYIIVGSLAGMVLGAVTTYFSVGIVCILFLSSTGNPSNDCARGQAIGILSILLGAYLGTVGGSVLTAKRPIAPSPNVR